MSKMSKTWTCTYNTHWQENIPKHWLCKTKTNIKYCSIASWLHTLSKRWLFKTPTIRSSIFWDGRSDDNKNPTTAGFSGSTCKCHCHENARLQPPPLNLPSHRGEVSRGGLRLPHFWHSWWGEGRGEIGSLSVFFWVACTEANLPVEVCKGMQRLSYNQFEVLRDCRKTSSRIQNKWITTNLA